MQQASESDVQVFSVEYRLAPEHPDPISFRGCYAGLTWIREQVQDFNIDPVRIVTMGESAGGGLGAGITLMA
jgi:acetyl esterase/lipase